jgi:hemoglobin/transferrin/lactoferrin receptor protein
MTTLEPRDLVQRGREGGGFAEVDYLQADRSITRTAAAAARGSVFEVAGGITRTDGHERDNRGEVDSTGATRTRPNPQDGSSQSQLAKIVMPVGESTRWRAAYDRFERHVASDVLSLNPQSVKTVSLAADDSARRERASLDVEALDWRGFDRITWLAYSQRSGTVQDTVEVRANTTSQCLSANGNVTCRREARFRFDQEETGTTAIATWSWGAQRFVAGGEASRTRSAEIRDGRQVNVSTGAVTNVVGTDVFPTRDFPVARVNRAGAFVQDEIAWGRARIIPGLRFDRFEMTPEPDAIFTTSNPGRNAVPAEDSAWSPKIGALVPLGGTATLALQYATGFRAPPYFDVNIGISNLPLGFTVIPNPDLKPETSRGAEASLRARAGGVDFSLTGFATDYRDLIVSRAPLPCPGDPRCVAGATLTFQSQNVTRARIVGAEARASVELGDWRARTGAAWTRGDDRSRGLPLNSIDPAKAVAGLSWQPRGSAWDAEVTVTAVARKKRLDSSAGTLIATPGFTLVDLTAGWKIGRHVSARAGLFNAFDRKYWWWSDVRGVLNAGPGFDRYTQPGRSFGVSLKVEL